MAGVEAGTMVGAFRIDRLIGSGSTGAVYEATQASLRRTVALRLVDAKRFATLAEAARFDDHQVRAASLHHPNLVPCYEVGEWNGGRFIAMRLIRGRTLAELVSEGSPPATGLLEPLAGALAAVRAAGLVHGRISARNILIEPDGIPFLADLGLGHPGSPEADVRALAHVVDGLPARAVSNRTRTAARALGVAVAVAVIGAAVLAHALTSGEGQPVPQDPPPAPPDTTAVGSALAASAVEPVGCSEDPSSNTPACTLAQTRLDGSELTVRRVGTIRGWAVRGASGDLALQVIRSRGGGWYVAGFSQPELLADPAPHRFPAEIGVRPGDTIAIGLGPGATVGGRTRSAGSAIVRWDGGLTAEPQTADASTRDVELMLRADIAFGVRAEGPRQLLGEDAAFAPAGRPLAAASVALSARRPARVAVVELHGGIAVDLVRGRRIARLEVPDADPDGELLELAQNCGPVGASGFCLRWRNPGDELPLQHEYRATGSGRIELIG